MAPPFFGGYSRATLRSNSHGYHAFGPKLALYLFVPIKYYKADVYQVYIDFLKEAFR
jgi:hypothetical protein